MKKITLSIIALFYFNFFYAQILKDSVLSYSTFIQSVIQYHPLVQNIRLQTIDKSKAYILKSRGFFDPKTYYHFDQKLFQSKNYYSIINGGLKIPTWIGADIKTEYNYNTGLYINSSDYLPSNGLWSIGASLPLLKNLFIDERRWAVKSSRIDLEMAEQEFNYELLNVLSDATYKYWQWFEVFNKYLLLKNITETSKNRLLATIQSAQLGDIPAIDTTETSIQYNNFLLQSQLAFIEFQNITNEIQFYFQWDKNQFNLSPNFTLYPQTFQAQNTKSIILEKDKIDTIIYQHPAYKKYLFKLQNLNLEKKFRIEMLKPQLDITYNALLIPSHPNDLIYNSNNYKWGIQFSFPLFLRKERGDLKLVNLKIKETRNELEIKKSELLIKANNYFNLYQTYLNQLVNINQLIERYQKMLDAERSKFAAGESSVFLVNARENYLFDAKLKQISFYSKLNLYKHLLELSLGQIPN